MPPQQPPARAGDTHRAALLLQVHNLRQELADLLLLPHRVLRLAGQLVGEVNNLLACFGWGRRGVHHHRGTAPQRQPMQRCWAVPADPPSPSPERSCPP